MGLEDAFCPYCNTPNALAVKHQSDMAHYREEYQRTQDSVMQKTSFVRQHGSWLAIIAVLLAAMVAGFILQVYAWDIGHSIRASNNEKYAAEDWAAMDAYLEQGDYGKFIGYYEANDIDLNYENPYQGLHTVAYAYTDILEYIAAINDSGSHYFKPDYVSGTCEYIAEYLIRIYTIEQQYSYDLDRYLPADKRAYLEDIRERTAVISKAYFGLTDEDIEEIPNISERKLARMIEEGVSS
jgi:hypothetical protein